MPAAWRLAINSLCGRPSRTALLIAAVALSAALIAVVSCAMATANAAVGAQLDATVGRAEVRITAASSGKTFDAAVLERARAWPEVKLAVGRLQAGLPLTFAQRVYVPGDDGRLSLQRRVPAATPLANGLMLPDELELRPIRLREGRLPEKPGEIVLDALSVERLAWDYIARSLAAPSQTFDRGDRGAASDDGVPQLVSEAEAKAYNAEQVPKVGSMIASSRGLLIRREVELEVVGIAEAPALGGRPQVYMTLEGLTQASGGDAGLSIVDILLEPGVDAAAFAAARQAELGRAFLVQTTERITSGLDKNMQSSQLGFVLAVVLAFMSAGFIILTGLTTSVSERQRELAILRCIGAARSTLAWSQLNVGLIVGLVGAVIGVPLGVAFAAAIVWAFRDRLVAGLAVEPWGLVLAVVGSVAAGVAGAAWPAWRAARATPLGGLASRAEAPRRGTIIALLVAGLAGLAVMFAIVGLPSDGQIVFWGYSIVGLPAMVIGYFVLSVPAVIVVTVLLAPAVSWILRLPPRMLARTVLSTPYRHGFTAGALMGGLALMISIWVNGGAILRDWLDNLKFPDAFVTGLNLTEESQRTLERLPFVADTCAITLQPIETDVFGVRALQKYKTTFIAFEPERFFRMAKLQWVQGSPETAIPALERGGAVIVAREFLVARGLGVGDTFRCEYNGVQHEFTIVGVVTSPGLDIVSKFFNVGEEFTDQALSAVFGSRADLKARFNSEAIHMVQVAFRDGVDDEEAVNTIRRELFEAGILDAGSGRKIRETIREFISGSLLVFSAVAVVAMLVACFGVANVIVAGVQARQFEFGVLRAVGASGSLLPRLVMGEALIMALTACVMGTLMGVQGSWAGQRMYELLLGLVLTLKIPLAPVAAGWAVLIVLTLLAAGPAAYRLARRRPRELLGAVRG